ncbi:Phage shock protein C [Cronobacter muytjensii 530]
MLTFALDPLDETQLLNAVDAELAAGEQRLRAMERYVTSDAFSLRSRFRQL